jgi:hypothetical protein
MAATQDDIKRWLESAKKEKAKYMIVMCDTFNWEDYPVNCKTAKECTEKYNNPGSMQKVMEVYDLSLNLEKQINEGRSFNLPK